MLSNEPVLPVERMLYHGAVVKIGRFDCPPDHPCFARTAPLFNNLFVFTRRPLWWRRGDGAYRFAGPGTALLHRAGGEVERRDVASTGDLSDWFGIRADIFEEALDRHGLHPSEVTHRPVAVVTSPRFRLRENQLLASLPQASAAKASVEEDVLTLFDEVCAGLSASADPPAATPGTRARRRRLADRAVALLDSLEGGYRGAQPNMSLSEIAQCLGTSIYHLCRVFRHECGMTMHAYRQRQRLGRAIDLMQNSRQDLTDLALELGYSSHGHFSRVFRQYVGRPPSAVNTASGIV